MHLVLGLALAVKQAKVSAKQLQRPDLVIAADLNTILSLFDASNGGPLLYGDVFGVDQFHSLKAVFADYTGEICAIGEGHAGKLFKNFVLRDLGPCFSVAHGLLDGCRNVIFRYQLPADIWVFIPGSLRGLCGVQIHKVFRDKSLLLVGQSCHTHHLSLKFPASALPPLCHKMTRTITQKNQMSRTGPHR